MIPCEEGLFAFICKEIYGVIHFLVQAKNEPGIFDSVEMGPTVHCNMAGWSTPEARAETPFVDYVLNATPDQIRFDAKESEEGGRFYREENRNLIVEADDSFPNEVPDEFIWMTVRQLKDMIRYNNFVNVEARSLLSCLIFWEMD
jgi:oxidase EvaA